MSPRHLLSLVASLVLASCLSASCSSNGAPQITAPAPPVPQPADDPPPPPLPSPPEHPDRCDHRNAQWAVGQQRTDDLLERARVAAGAEFARALRMGQPVTLEYRIGRLNLAFDEHGVVRLVWCG